MYPIFIYLLATAKVMQKMGTPRGRRDGGHPVGLRETRMPPARNAHTLPVGLRRTRIPLRETRTLSPWGLCGTRIPPARNAHAPEGTANQPRTRARRAFTSPSRARAHARAHARVTI